MNVAQLTFNKLLFSTATAIARERHAEGDYYNNIGLYYLLAPAVTVGETEGAMDSTSVFFWPLLLPITL